MRHRAVPTSALKSPIPRRGLVAARLIEVVPVLTFIVCVCFYLLSLAKALSVSLAPLVAQAAGEALHREVSLKRVNLVTVPGRVILEDLVVSNHATFAEDHGRPMIDADRVTVKYSLPEMFQHPKNIAAAIGDIDINGASGYVERLPRNTFNFSDLIPKNARPEKQAYLGTVTLRNATLFFRDETAVPALRKKVMTITDIRTTIDLTSTQFVSFNGHASSGNRLFEIVKFDGELFRNVGDLANDGSDQGLRIHVNIKRAAAPYLVDDFLPQAAPFMKVTGGRIDADVTLSQIAKLPKHKLDVQGTAHIDGLSFVELKHQALTHPATNVGGDIFFTENQATLLMAGVTNGIPIKVSGALFGFPQMQLALRVDLPQLPIEKLPSTLAFMPPLPPEVRFPGYGSASVALTGDALDLNASASLETPSVVLAGLPFKNIRTDATYSRGLLSIKTLSATQVQGGGVFTAQGLVDTRPSPAALVFSGSLANVNLAGIKLPAKTAQQVGKLGGIATLRFVASSGKPGLPGGIPPLKHGVPSAVLGPIHAQAALNIADASVHGVVFDRVSGRVQYQQGEGAHVSELYAKDKRGGVVLVSGDIPMPGNAGGRFDLSVNAARIQIGPILDALGTPDTHGTGYFKGRLTGAIQDPNLFGKLSLVAPKYKQNGIDLATGHVQYHAGNVELQDFTIQVEPALARLNGTIMHVADKNPAFDLQVELNRAQISDIISFIPPDVLAKSDDPNTQRVLKSATGLVNTNVTLGGTLKSPKLKGDLSIANATFEAYHVTNVQGTFDLADNLLRVPHFSLVYEDAVVAGGGSFDMDAQTVKASFTGNNIDVARFGALFAKGIPMSGKVAVAGKVSGSAKDPDVSALLITDSVKVGVFSFDTIKAGARLHHGVLSSTGVPIMIAFDGAKYSVTNYSVDTKSHAVSLTAKVEGQRLSTLLTRVENSHWIMNKLSDSAITALYQLPQPFDGVIDAPNITVSGTLEKPAFSAVVNATGIVVGANHIDQVHADVAYKGTVLTVKELTSRGKLAYMSAAGTVDFKGPIDAQLEASNISLALLNPFLPGTAKVGGTLADLTIVAKGKTRSPEVTASVTLDKPSFNAIDFDRLDSGRISIANRQLTIDGLTISKDEKLKDGATIQHIASVRGSIPFDWEDVNGTPMPVFPTNVPMNLHASIPEQSLSVVALFAPKLAESAFSGMFHADVDIGGTLADKRLSGEIGISKGKVKPPGFQTGLVNIETLVQFSGNKASVIRATADSDRKNGGSIGASGSVYFGGGRAPVTTGLADALLGGVSLDLSISANKFRVAEPKLVQFGNAGFGSLVDGGVTLTQTMLAPLISGSIKLSDTSITLPTAQAATGGVAAAPLVNPRFNVTVVAARGTKVDSPQVKISDASGGFGLHGSLDVPNLKGQLIINKGTFNLPTARFRVVSGGTVDVNYNPESPTDSSAMTIGVNLEAKTSISISQRTLVSNQGSVNTGVAVSPSLLGAYSGSERYNITAIINGTLRSDGTGLTLKFSSDPTLAESQILAALGGQFVRDIGNGAVDTGLRSLFAQVLSNQLGSVFFDSLYDTTGLDVSLDYNPGLPFVVSLSKQLTPRLEVTFTRMEASRTSGAVASTLDPPQYQLRLGYNLSKRLRFSVSTDDQRSYGVALEGVFRF
ncbi:MAG TPA: translocation/assembly module TamB domain-containing protein [Capsulimonadaceae bacterium]|jgi:hypothetical protein